MLGPRQSKIFNTRTGASIAPTGLVAFAKMPSFSPDGKKIVFNDHDSGQGHSVAVMDFDNATNTFSNRVEIFRDATLFPGWPFFTPDGLEVIFALGNGSDYATIQDPPTGLQVNRSNLMIVDLKNKNARPLDLANGKGLPTRDRDLNYYPTVSPVAAGGYFRAFSTSRRSYGNLMTQLEIDAVTKKIWVAAIDIEAPHGEIPGPLMGDPAIPRSTFRAKSSDPATSAPSPPSHPARPTARRAPAGSTAAEVSARTACARWRRLRARKSKTNARRAPIAARRHPRSSASLDAARCLPSSSSEDGELTTSPGAIAGGTPDRVRLALDENRAESMIAGQTHTFAAARNSSPASPVDRRQK